VLIEPEIDPTEDHRRECLGRQVKVACPFRVYYLCRGRQVGDRSFGHLVANPATPTDQGSPQRPKAGPCPWVCASNACKGIIGNASRQRMPTARGDEVGQRPRPESRYGGDAPAFTGPLACKSSSLLFRMTSVVMAFIQAGASSGS